MNIRKRKKTRVKTTNLIHQVDQLHGQSTPFCNKRTYFQLNNLEKLPSKKREEIQENQLVKQTKSKTANKKGTIVTMNEKSIKTKGKKFHLP